ncbi:thioredoxin family protein [Pendulispora brunnea]|uniref:Thioredoxin family protein n=1 Tax=Pendulispora brunnea TaxID=2905690 RepID=A0ABZ2KM98_9BACT
MRHVVFLAATVLGFVTAGCGHQSSSASSTPATQQTTAASARAKDAPLPFIEDDYPRALAEAKAKNKPLFVDGWATWCHSCLSLKSYVLTAPEMRAQADNFVWLSVDSEKDQNAPFFQKFGLSVLPTLWVIDPQTEQISWKLAGALTAPELAAALDGVRKKDGNANEAESLFAEGVRADAHKDPAGAARLYEKALAASPRTWNHRAEAVAAYVTDLSTIKQAERCAEVADHEAHTLPMGSYRVNAAVIGAGCAQDQPQGSPAHAHLAPLVKELTDIVHTKAKILADDRSGAFDELISALKSEGKKDVAKQMAAEWAAFLEGEAQRAPDAKGRAVFDAHRLLAYLELGDPARAIPMFSQTERDFPDDYNPPARLSRTYFELKRYDEALDAASRAISKSYGPRKLRLYQLKADIAAAKKDSAAERQALDEALQFASTLSLRDGYEKLRAQLAERRAKLGSGATAQR